MADETSIDVSKKSVAELLSSGARSRFLIPEYQRPYAWGADQVDTLFDDLVEHAGSDASSEYFLGCVVTYRNEGRREVIDGQQRLTTLFLLLRVLYRKLEGMSDSPARTNLMNRITPALWRTDRITGMADRTATLIESRAIDDDADAMLKLILETGETDPAAHDAYSTNYRLLEKRVDDYAAAETLAFPGFIATLLDNVVVLPIRADSQDAALMIFNTLNDRGLSLSDADIFKAKMYRYAGDGRDRFVGEWRRISAEAEQAGQSMQSLFAQYMYVLWAREGNSGSRMPRMRRWYAENDFRRLRSGNVLGELDAILNVWRVASGHESIEGEPWSMDGAILRTLDVLASYPNDFWKYPTVIYYLTHRAEEDFGAGFLAFLRCLAACLAAKFAVTPTVNGVKSSVFRLNARILDSAEPSFDFPKVDADELRHRIVEPHGSLVRMLLKIIAYHEPSQHDLLPDRWEIEHVFPQKWDDMRFPALEDREVRARLEHLGNKVPFEKPLNIKASNGYFSKKRKYYAQSGITVTNRLGAEHDDWDLDDILERDRRVADLVMDDFTAWGLEFAKPKPEER